MVKKLSYLLLGLPLLALFVVLILGSISPILTKSVAEAQLNLSQEKAWERLMDFAAYPKWRRDVASVDRISTSSAPLAWKEIFQDQTEAEWELIDARPPDYIVINRIVRDKQENERWILTLYTKEDKTMLRVEIREAVLSPFKRAVVQVRNLFANPANKYLRSLAGGF